MPYLKGWIQKIPSNLYFWQAHSSEILPQTYEIIPYLTKFTKHGQLPQKINLFSAKCSFFFPDEKDVHISTHKHQNRATIYIQISVQLQKIWERTNNGPIYLQTGGYVHARVFFNNTGRASPVCVGDLTEPGNITGESAKQLPMF